MRHLISWLAAYRHIRKNIYANRGTVFQHMDTITFKNANPATLVR